MARLGGTARELADALAQVRDLQDEPGRQAFVHAIGEALGRPLLVDSRGSPKVFLYNVVLECRDRPGGMEALLQAVDFLAGGTYAAVRVRRLISPAAELLDPSAEGRIKELLQGLRIPSLSRIYHAAVGNSVSPWPATLDDAWEAFCLLLDANAGTDGVPPHLLFVALLVRAMERQRSVADVWRLDRLRAWLDEQVAVLRAEGGATTEDLDLLRDQKELQLGQTDIYLIIQLEPVDDLAAGGRMVRMSHWKQIHPFEWRPERGEDRVIAVEEIPAAVSELIQEAEGGWAYQLDDSLVLEFVLPLSLLHLAPDEWTRDPPDEPYPTPLGTEYEVIVRSHERMYTRTMHRAWRQRWQVLAEAAECLVYWPDKGDPQEPEMLRDRLMTDPNVVVCVLSSAPDRDPGRTELRMALRAGVPVVLWHRGDAEPGALRDALHEVIERPDFRDLPADLKLLRGRQAANDGQGPVYVDALTLIYDNPGHFLGDAQPLQPPQW
jgi:hypothetical protein